MIFETCHNYLGSYWFTPVSPWSGHNRRGIGKDVTRGSYGGQFGKGLVTGNMGQCLLLGNDVKMELVKVKMQD